MRLALPSLLSLATLSTLAGYAMLAYQHCDQPIALTAYCLILAGLSAGGHGRPPCQDVAADFDRRWPGADN